MTWLKLRTFLFQEKVANHWVKLSIAMNYLIYWWTNRMLFYHKNNSLAFCLKRTKDLFWMNRKIYLLDSNVSAIWSMESVYWCIKNNFLLCGSSNMLNKVKSFGLFELCLTVSRNEKRVLWFKAKPGIQPY